MKSDDRVTSSWLSLTEYHVRVSCALSADVRWLGLQNREILWGSVTNQEVPVKGKRRSVLISAAQMCQRWILLWVMRGE